MADRIIQTERPTRPNSSSVGPVPDSSNVVPLVMTLGWYGAGSVLRTENPVFDDGWK